MSEDKRSMPRLPRYDYEDRMAWDRIMEDNKRALLQAEQRLRGIVVKYGLDGAS